MRKNVDKWWYKVWRSDNGLCLRNNLPEGTVTTDTLPEAGSGSTSSEVTTTLTPDPEYRGNKQCNEMSTPVLTNSDLHQIWVKTQILTKFGWPNLNFRQN